MEAVAFQNYYEVLDVAPTASSEALERRFRFLARRYHPDNQETGDRRRFDMILEAHGALRDPAKRAMYHIEHQSHFPPGCQWGDFATSESGGVGSRMETNTAPEESDLCRVSPRIERDASVQDRLLTILYLRRRKNVREPGVGDVELERLSSCEPEHLEFHLWYLKEKGWVATGDDGLFVITAAGVDRTSLLHRAEAEKKLISDQS